MSTIFITIPSYEDPFLFRTIDEAISNAKYPENLHFAIGLQYSEETMPDLSKFSTNNIKYLSYSPENRPGVARIRDHLLDLYDKEDYYLGIDSHMRFEKNWDEGIISIFEDLKKQHGNDIVWSEPLPSELNQGMGNHISFEWDLADQPVYIDDNTDDTSARPYLLVGKTLPETKIIDGRFMDYHYCSGHFFFSDGRVITDVDLHNFAEIYEEEPFRFFRLAISGWRSFSVSDSNLIAHDNGEYNKVIYGDHINDSNYIQLKRFGRKKEDLGKVIAVDLAILFNDGPAKVKTAKITPEEFFSRFGLEEKHKRLKDFYLANYDEFLKIAIDSIDK